MYWGIVFLAAAVLAVHAEHPVCFSGKLDLVLVIDVSGSNELRYITNRDAALELARSLPVNWDKCVIAVIQYSKTAIMKLEFGSSNNIDVVNDTISTLDWTGDVAQTADAMDLAMIMFRRARPDAQRAIVLFSDGNSFNTWTEVTATSERLKYSEAKIFAVSLAGNTYETELKQYISFSNGSIIRRQSEFQDLKRELLSMTVPRCPPPAAAPPPDFHAPIDTGASVLSPDGDTPPENQLPTRRVENQENHLPTRRAENQLPARRTTRRSPITRTTRSAVVITTTTLPTTTTAGLVVPVASANPALIGATVGDITLDKRKN